MYEIICTTIPTEAGFLWIMSVVPLGLVQCVRWIPKRANAIAVVNTSPTMTRCFWNSNPRKEYEAPHLECWGLFTILISRCEMRVEARAVADLKRIQERQGASILRTRLPLKPTRGGELAHVICFLFWPHLHPLPLYFTFLPSYLLHFASFLTPYTKSIFHEEKAGVIFTTPHLLAVLNGIPCAAPNSTELCLCITEPTYLGPIQ
jgi:hypothetical protein